MGAGSVAFFNTHLTSATTSFRRVWLYTRRMSAVPTRIPRIRTASLAWEGEAMALDDVPSRFVLDVIREMSPGLVPAWNVCLERRFEEHESATVDEYAAFFLREHNLTLLGEAPVARWAEFYRGWT